MVMMVRRKGKRERQEIVEGLLCGGKNLDKKKR